MAYELTIPGQLFAVQDALGIGTASADARLGSFSGALRVGRSTNLVLVGDSKGYGDTGWFRRMANSAVALSPQDSKPQINYFAYDNANNMWLSRVPLQSGEDRYAIFKAGTAYQNGARQLRPDLGDMAEFGNAVDYDFSVDMMPDAQPPAANEIIASRQGGAGSRGWIWQRAVNGDVQFIWYPDPMAETAITATLTAANLSSAPNPLQTGMRSKLRVTLDIDNSNGGYTARWYTAPANSDSWTEVAAAALVTASGTTQVGIPVATSVPYQIGARSNTTGLMQGRIYEIMLRQGINGRILNPQPISAWLPYSGVLLSDAAMGGVGTINFWNGSYLGGTGTILLARPNLFPATSEGIYLLATGDNEPTVGSPFKNALDNFLSATRTYNPAVPVGIVSLNPNDSRFGNYRSQHYRMMFIQRWAALNNLPLIDGFNAFARLADRGSSLLLTDGQHPKDGSDGTGDGMSLMAKVAAKSLGLMNAGLAT